MDSFAFSAGLASQSDLVLTSSVNWSGDAAQIIERDAQQEFEVSEELDLCLTTADLIGTEERRSVTGRESWGNYFAKKSPPMGDLCGSHGVDENTKRPLFDQSANAKHLNPSKQAPSHLASKLAMISEQEMKELSVRNSLDDTREKQQNEDEDADDDEHDAMLINQSLDGQAMDGMVASKSIESINLSDLQQLNPSYLSGSPLCSNRDSNATHKTSSNRDSDLSSRRGSLNRLIQIAKLAQIQRFYQFKLDEDALHELLRQSDDGCNDVEEEVERLMHAFLDEFYAEPTRASLSAVTFKAEERKCTALVLFEEEASAEKEWMQHFMSFGPISAIRDKNEAPVFTQLSA